MSLFHLSDPKPEEEVLTLHQDKNLRIERIVSWGQKSPDDFWYDQDEHEWVSLLRGEATLGFENRPSLKLSAGDQVFIPAHEKHRVEYTHSPTIWLCVFYS